MKAIVTGVNGTVAPVLAASLQAAGHTVIPWDRSQVPTDNLPAIRAFIERERPDWFFHIATGSPDWASAVAEICGEHGIPFLFTSSVSVFSSDQQGPFTIESVPQPNDEYGNYKLDCERQVVAAHPAAIVARIGWQIGRTSGANHMVDYLDRTFRAEGRIHASTAWYQASSLLEDTAESLIELIERHPAGLYHLDGNPGLSFYEIASGLKQWLTTPWVIVPSDSPVQNNLLHDQRISVRPLNQNWG